MVLAFWCDPGFGASSRGQIVASALVGEWWPSHSQGEKFGWLDEELCGENQLFGEPKSWAPES